MHLALPFKQPSFPLSVIDVAVLVGHHSLAVNHVEVPFAAVHVAGHVEHGAQAIAELFDDFADVNVAVVVFHVLELGVGLYLRKIQLLGLDGFLVNHGLHFLGGQRRAESRQGKQKYETEAFIHGSAYYSTNATISPFSTFFPWRPVTATIRPSRAGTIGSMPYLVCT